MLDDSILKTFQEAGTTQNYFFFHATVSEPAAEVLLGELNCGAWPLPVLFQFLREISSVRSVLDVTSAPPTAALYLESSLQESGGPWG